jgi:hypothetical protein
MNDERAKALVGALLQSDLMDKSATYLEGGRKFGALSLEQLNEQWVRAIRKWARADYGPSRELNDLAAELRLRNSEEPWDRVSEVRDEMVTAAKRSGQKNNREVRAKMKEFLEAMDKPQN